MVLVLTTKSLRHLVEGVAEVDGSVGVGGAVVEDVPWRPARAARIWP